MHEIFNLEKIYRAYLDCRKNKRKTANALKFEQNLEKNLFVLKKELLAKTYRPGRSICFVVTDPKPREIFAADFRDRVVHHLLIREVEKMGENALICDAFSCRKGKGTHLAVDRLKKLIRQTSQNYRYKAYYIQMDIDSFFMSIDHDILYSLFKKLVIGKKRSERWKRDILWLARTVIYHKPTKNYVIKGPKSPFSLIPSRKSLFCSGEKRGLPIGNYSSQFMANLYLNELDQFVKRELKIKSYIRYVDDFILLSLNRDELKEFRDKINLFLSQKLRLELNPVKTKIQPISAGLDFLGYLINPDRVLVRARVVERLRGKIRFWNFKANQNRKTILSSFNSYCGHFRQANTFNLRKRLFEKELGGLKRCFYAQNDYKRLRLRKTAPERLSPEASPFHFQ